MTLDRNVILKKISVNLTPKDFENLTFLKELLGERSQTSVISRALTISFLLIRLLNEDPDSKIIIKNNKTNESKEIILL